MDYYSKYVEISELSSLTSGAVVTKLKSMFARWGVPKNIVTDNGPCFASNEFAQFVKSCEIAHTTTSPHHPQSNGQAESGVKIAKRIVCQKDPFLALLSYRATPTQATGLSPAQLIMGRKIVTHLPTLDKSLKPEWPNYDVVKSNQELYKESYARNYNKQHGARSLPRLEPGDSVRLKTDEQRS
jgi:transposase InsO family protein